MLVAAEQISAQGSAAPTSPGPQHRLLAPALTDLRFRTLVGEAAWGRLPEAVCRRFSKCLAPDDALFYCGKVVTTELSWAGRILAFLARAIGGPLPLTGDATGPALVVVTEDV